MKASPFGIYFCFKSAIRNPQSSVDRLGLRLFRALRALFFEERGLVLHVADERVHDCLGEAEYGRAEYDAGDAEGVRARDEADEHPVEVEALGAARGEL